MYEDLLRGTVFGGQHAPLLKAMKRPGSIQSGSEAGSYPITDAGSLSDAIQAYGRAKNKTAVKAHIKARAKALGLTEKLPDDWK